MTAKLKDWARSYRWHETKGSAEVHGEDDGDMDEWVADAKASFVCTVGTGNHLHICGGTGAVPITAEDGPTDRNGEPIWNGDAACLIHLPVALANEPEKVPS